MAHDTLTLPPHLAPWRLAGVDYVLTAYDLPPEFSLCREAPAVPTVVPTARAAAPPRPRPSPEVPPAAAAVPADPALPLHQWPAQWQERLRITRPAPVLWTYWTLGEDLCGTPNPARRDLLRRLLADLGQPAGTHCFWPVALPDKDGLTAHGPVFWAGVEALKARALVVMGSPAAEVMGLPAHLRPFQQTRHRGRLIVFLRDMDALTDERPQYEAVRAFLRQALAPFAARMATPAERG